MTLRDVAREAAGELCEVPSHAQLYLERLVDFFAERPEHWDTFCIEVSHRKMQLEAET